jgi:TatD DNase family protein
MAEFFDTHAHLDYPDFADELPDVIRRAASAGVSKIVTIATTRRAARGRSPLLRNSLMYMPS